jgi:anti-sigma regulatory factor (Ser/Thr protein kinase)
VPEAVRDARVVTRAVLRDWSVPEDVVDDALLVVSELVTNAVRHAPGHDGVELGLVEDDGKLRVSLIDGSTTSPLPREAAAGAEDGRGMAIVAALADRWGIAPHLGGKQVWWEVDLRARYRFATHQVEHRQTDSAGQH